MRDRTKRRLVLTVRCLLVTSLLVPAVVWPLSEQHTAGLELLSLVSTLVWLGSTVFLIGFLVQSLLRWALREQVDEDQETREESTFINPEDLP